MLFYLGHGGVHPPQQRQSLVCGLFVGMQRNLRAQAAYFLAEFVRFGFEHRLRLRRGFGAEHLHIFRLRIGSRIGNHP